MASEVVVGALVRDGRVLLGHRGPGRLHFPDCWALPGGHVEADEDPIHALVRELREEIGVDATVTGPPSLRLEQEPEGGVPWGGGVSGPRSRRRRGRVTV